MLSNIGVLEQQYQELEYGCFYMRGISYGGKSSLHAEALIFTIDIIDKIMTKK